MREREKERWTFILVGEGDQKSIRLLVGILINAYKV
jgi:hypothetical protein